jgi:hypothetical protein
MWMTTATPPVGRSVNVAQPLTFEPLRGSIVARACAPAAGGDAVVDADLQPAMSRAAAAATAKAAARIEILVVFIFPPSRFR